MKLLRSRAFAVAVSALLCLTFAILGLNRSIAKETDRYEAGFYDGVRVEDGNYTSASIYSVLASCCNHSLTLASVFADCAPVTDQAGTLLAARRGLIEAMDRKDISAMYTANSGLTAAAEDLMTAAQSAQLTDGDHEKADDAYAKLTSAENALVNNPYNDSLLPFSQKIMGTLPSQLLGWAVFVRGPQGFGR